MSNLSDLEREVFALEVDNLLAISELTLLQEMRPLVERLLEEVDALVESGNDITDEELERLVVPLNDALAAGLEREMVALQVPLRQEAENWSPVVPDSQAPFSDGTTLMRRAEMDGTSMVEWFRRRSPSQWMRGMIDELRKGIEAGWQRDRAGRASAAAGIQRLVTTAIETGIWSSSNGTLQRNWVSSDLGWYTRQDERVCSICRPLNGEQISTIGRRPPAHPRCRCVALPPRAAGSS